MERECALVAQGEADGFDFPGFAGGEVAEGALPDLAVLTIGTVQQNPGVGLAVGASNFGSVDKHTVTTKLGVCLSI